MKLFRKLFIPLLLPFSILYGTVSFLFLRLRALRRIDVGVPVVSIGNFYAGGVGKTPLVILVAKILREKGFDPLVVTKSYKASLKSAEEVFENSDIKKVGDEALMIKKLEPGLRVYSGPDKVETLKTAQPNYKQNTIVILDDGAQRTDIIKTVKIHVWDLTKSLLSLMPFPLGYSREFWFLGEKPDLNIFNRVEGYEKRAKSLKKILKSPVLYSEYKIKGITNKGSFKNLENDFILISGLGNFNQLLDSVKKFISDKSFKMENFISGKDHDNFLWFKPQADKFYVCTEKDYLKLQDKVEKEKLFVVQSVFSEFFRKEIEARLLNILQEKI